MARERCECRLAVADYLKWRGQDAPADAMVQQAIAGFRELAANDRASRKGLAMALVLFARLPTARDQSLVEKSWVEALRLFRPLCAESPDNEELAEAAGSVGVELGYAYRMTGRFAESMSLYDEAITRLEKPARQPTARFSLQWYLFQGFDARAQLHFAAGRAAEGMADLRRSLDATPRTMRLALEKIRWLRHSATSGRTAVVVEMCELLVVDGTSEELNWAARLTAIASLKADAALAARARKAALAALSKVGPPDDPEHADWDAIRQEPEFQAMLKELKK